MDEVTETVQGVENMRLMDIETGTEYVPCHKLVDGTLLISIEEDIKQIDKIVMANGTSGWWFEKMKNNEGNEHGNKRSE